MSDKRRIESAIQTGRVRARQWFEQYRQQEGAESASDFLRLLVQRLPPDAHAMLNQISPDMHRRVIDKVQGGKDANKR